MSKIRDLVLSDRFVHSIKTALACFIGFVAAHFIHFRIDQWLIITILVVMCAQINVGSMLMKSYMRFLGTLTGSAIAIVTLLLFGNDPLVAAIVISVSAMLFSFVATSNKSFNESGTLGAVTVAIILLGVQPTAASGVERCIEICIGLAIAALVSQFILPIHARERLRRNQAATLEQLKQYYAVTLMDENPQEATWLALDEKIAKSLIKQRKLADESMREKLGPHFRLNLFNHLLWCEKEILRSITFMHHAHQSVIALEIWHTNKTLLQNFHHDASKALHAVALRIEKVEPREFIVIPDITNLKNALLQSIRECSEEERIAVDTFLFSAQILLSRLARLAELVVQLNKPELSS